jgi:hypothetical protein
MLVQVALQQRYFLSLRKCRSRIAGADRGSSEEPDHDRTTRRDL